MILCLLISHLRIPNRQFFLVNHAVVLGLLDCEAADHSGQCSAKSFVFYHLTLELLWRRGTRLWQALLTLESGYVGETALVSILERDLVACEIVFGLEPIVEGEDVTELVHRKISGSSLIY